MISMPSAVDADIPKTRPFMPPTSPRFEERPEVLQSLPQLYFEALFRSAFLLRMSPGFLRQRAPPRPGLVSAVVLDRTNLHVTHAAPKPVRRDLGDFVLRSCDQSIGHEHETKDRLRGSKTCLGSKLSLRG